MLMNNNPPNFTASVLDSIHHGKLTVALQILTAENGGSRHGGVLAMASVWSDRNDSQFSSTVIGRPGVKIGRYARNAAEKIARLMERRAEGNEEVAASESADEAHDTYGGCIVFKSKKKFDLEVYISFSGAPPEVDEAIVFVIGEMLGLVTPAYENQLITRARELMKNIMMFG